MITENYVSFEVAKLLKKAGFEEECVTNYYDSGVRINNFGKAKLIKHTFKNGIGINCDIKRGILFFIVSKVNIKEVKYKAKPAPEKYGFIKRRII